MAKEEKKAPKLRFNGYTNDWEQRKFGDLYKKVSEKMIELMVLIKLFLSQICIIKVM